MFRIILILGITLATTPLFADEAADKAEFKRLYAKFNDLYQNSEDIDPIIETGEKLYKLTPKIYGKNSQNTAVVTYNLASLYDEKGGEKYNTDEERAFALYKEYFANLTSRKVTKDKNYLNQYVAFLKSEQNIAMTRSSGRYMKTALDIAKEIELSAVDTANLEMILAKERYNSLKKADARNLYQNARLKYEKEFGPLHFKVGETSFWIAQIEKQGNRTKKAILEYERAINALKDQQQEAAQSIVLLSHRNLATIYAKNGKDDDASRHIIAFAMKKPQQNSRAMIDIYQPSPKFSRAAGDAAKKGNNTVQLSFDVDEKGFTRNIRVYSNTPEILNKAVIKAVEKYRYVPLVIDGKLLTRKDFNYSFTYTVRK